MPLIRLLNPYKIKKNKLVKIFAHNQKNYYFCSSE